MISILMIAALPYVAGLVGYDCGGQSLNITTLSLLDMEDCITDNIEPVKRDVFVQLMQTSDYDHTTVIQCKVEIDRNIHYCGMHSHVSAVSGGKREYIEELGSHGCRHAHDTGTMTIGTAVLDRLIRNTTNSRSVTLAGHITNDGRCSGTQYSDGYGTWDGVVVQASIKVTLKSFETPIKRTTGRIMLPSGAQCNVNDGYCIDSEGAESYWSPLPLDSCHFDRYDILYEGPAVKLIPKENQTTPVVYTVETRGTTFALSKVAETDICGYKLAQTEHPKLFILETSKEKTFKSRSRITVDNLDIFTYVNSKFIYVEKHVKTQLTQLYKDLIEQKCAVEKQVLQNALSLASIAPDEMAFRIMKGPGYTAVTSGEVIHLIKCVPVECKIRHTEECYAELPVSYNNQSYFLLPRSHILTTLGTTRECSSLLPAMYRIHGGWFRITPKPLESIPPPRLQPLSRPTWHYVSPSTLASSGIYSDDDLERLKSHIMFPVEKPSMLNTIARGAMGENIPEGSISMYNLLDEASLNKIAESAGAKLWKGFITFGSASAGVLAIILLARLAKLIIDTIIHGYALHTVYGWSIHLLGAIWSSVTHLLLHLEGRREKDPTAPTEEDPEKPLSTTEEPKPGPSDTTQYGYSKLRKYLEEV